MDWFWTAFNWQTWTFAAVMYCLGSGVASIRSIGWKFAVGTVAGAGLVWVCLNVTVTGLPFFA